MAPRIEVLVKPGCHLCEDALMALQRLDAELGFGWVARDVSADPALLARWHDELPVIFLDGRQHAFWRVDEVRLRLALAR